MPGETIRLIDDQGTIRDVPVEAAGSAIDSGWRVPTHEQEAGRVVEQAREETYGGVGGAVKAGVAGLARGVTVGLSDVVARGLGGEDTAIALEGLREAHPGISTGTEVVGAVAPAFLSAGASTPASAAGAAGRGVAELVGGGIRGAIAGGAVEGGIFGVGQGISNLALSTDPLTLERIGSELSSNALFGAAAGGVLGGAGKAAERGLLRAKGAIDEALERRAAATKARTPAEAIETGDLELLTPKILNAAETAEKTRIHAEQAPQRKAFADDLDVWRRENRDAHDLRAIAKASDDPNLREAGGAFDRANFGLRSKLDDKVGFAADPLGSLKAVRTQGQALEEMRAAAALQEQAWKADVASAPERFRARIVAGDMAGEVGPFTPSGLDLAVERALKEHAGYAWGPKAAIRDGLQTPPIVNRIPVIDSMIEANRKLQGKLEEIARPPTSELLTKIADARAALEVPKQPSAGAAVFSAVAPFAGPLGAAAAAGGRVVGSLRKLAGAIGEKTGKAASAFLGPAAAAAGQAHPVATRILLSARFGPHDGEDEPKTLPELFRRRTEEIKRQTEYDETGTPRLRFEARKEMAKLLSPIAAVDPIAADRLETMAARRIEYLSSKIPRRPDFGTPQLGPDTWHPSDMEMRAWARRVDAVEHPDAVEERAQHGSLSPEDAEAYWAVHPERAQAFTQLILGKLPTLKEKLPYAKRLTLGIFTGKPIDPSMHPRVIAALQSSFPIEPGSQGGTQAPRAAPQFGSLKKTAADMKTPAQERMR